MKVVRTFLTFGVMLVSIGICNAQNYSSSTFKDFGKLAGKWKGTLTYLDYSSGKPFTMPVELQIGKIDKTSNYTFSNFYPNEPKANSIDTVNISADGKYIDQELIKSRKKLDNGAIELITEELGKDGNENKQAILRHTYILAKDTFSKTKDVQFVGETKWIKRSEYLFRKNHNK